MAVVLGARLLRRPRRTAVTVPPAITESFMARIAVEVLLVAVEAMMRVGTTWVVVVAAAAVAWWWWIVEIAQF